MEQAYSSLINNPTEMSCFGSMLLFIKSSQYSNWAPTSIDLAYLFYKVEI